jgi:hypothetical protein
VRFGDGLEVSQRLCEVALLHERAAAFELPARDVLIRARGLTLGERGGRREQETSRHEPHTIADASCHAHACSVLRRPKLDLLAPAGRHRDPLRGRRLAVGAF